MMPVPTESQEQTTLFHWAALNERRWPMLRWMFAVPNGSVRNKITGARLKREGVKRGVPDICLPVPASDDVAPGVRRHYCGLWIELKRLKGGRTDPEQIKWQIHLRSVGYRAEVCLGWVAARKVICEYLGVTA